MASSLFVQPGRGSHIGLVLLSQGRGRRLGPQTRLAFVAGPGSRGCRGFTLHEAINFFSSENLQKFNISKCQEKI